MRTNFMGLSLKNPIVTGAGPWSRDAASIRRSHEQGADCVITETITMEVGVSHQPRLYQSQGFF